MLDPATVSRICCLGLLAGMAASWPVWFGPRAFPPIPVLFEGPQWMGSALSAMLMAVLLIGLWRPGRPVVASAFVLTAVLVALDVNRLQPWVYLYLLILVICSARVEQVRPLIVLVLAFVYFWSGLLKLNPAFAREVFPWLAEPLLGSAAVPALGIAGAALEGAAALLLLWPRSRRIAASILAAMHVFILLCIGPLGRDFNMTVWPWNLAMVALLILVAGWGESVPLSSLRRPSFALAAVLVGVLPGLSIWGWWPEYLSFSLYSGRARYALLTFSSAEEVPATIPEAARIGGTTVDVAAWALQDLGVPPFPEPWAYRSLAKQFPSSRLSISVKDPWGGSTKVYRGR